MHSWPLLVTLLIRPIQFTVYFLSGFVPRDARRWALGTWSGQRFADNAAAVFLHCEDHEAEELDVAWITAQRSIRDRLRADGHRAMTRWSPSGIWWCLRSGVYIYDTIPRDINFWLSRRAKLVLLRHGIGLKKIERAIDSPSHRLYKLFHGNRIQRLVYGAALPWHRPIPDLVTACSEEHAQQAVKYFGVDRKAVRMTGFPRHDRLLSLPRNGRESLPSVGAAVPADRPVFLYLPTFRENVSSQTFDWDGLESSASAAGVTVAVKLHMVDAARGVLEPERVARSDWLRQLDSDCDPIDLFGDADGMITDFSSVSFDFLLIDKPIIYFALDASQFIHSRPLIYPLESVAAGPVCNTVAELTSALIEATSGGPDRFSLRRAQMRERFHDVEIGGASARVVKSVKELQQIDQSSSELGARR